jgi:hypothetical protein
MDNKIMSHNTTKLTSKRCRGVIIPQYKKSKETRFNPLWGKPNEDEFETIYVSVEINSVCADCKKIECKDSDGKNKKEVEV